MSLHHCPLTWASVTYGASLLKQGLIWIIGDETCTKFWVDNCSGCWIWCNFAADPSYIDARYSCAGLLAWLPANVVDHIFSILMVEKLWICLTTPFWCLYIVTMTINGRRVFTLKAKDLFLASISKTMDSSPMSTGGKVSWLKKKSPVLIKATYIQASLSLKVPG